MTPAIVLASHTSGLGVIRALAAKSVPVVVVYYSKSDIGYHSKYVKESYFAPHPEENEQGFIDFLLDIAPKYEGSVLFPADDETLVAASKNKERLEQHYLVACAEWEVVEHIIDKKYSYALAEEIGVAVPRTFTPSSEEEAREFGSTVEFPCLIKPSVGHRYFEAFNRKMILVHNEEELLKHYIEAVQSENEVMIQEFIPGDDTCGVNFNSYRVAGESLVEFTAEKVRLYPMNFGVPCVVVSKEIPEIVEPGRRMLQALNYSGYACAEFKRDKRDGTYKFMEINGRQNLSVLHAMRCEINFPWMTYEHLVAGKLPSSDGHPNGIYWIDSTKDVISSLRYCRRRGGSWSQYWTPYFAPHIFAIFDWPDIVPYLKRCAVLSSLGVRALLSRVRGVFAQS